jgi:hypothetical protein
MGNGSAQQNEASKRKTQTQEQSVLCRIVSGLDVAGET